MVARSSFALWIISGMTSMPVLRRCSERRKRPSMARTMQVMVLIRCPEARARNQFAMRLKSDAQPRHVDDAPAAHVGRGEHEACAGLRDPVEQLADVLGPVGKVDVEHDDVGAAALREAGLERLAEAEVARVVEHTDAVEFLGELRRQSRRSGRGCRR